MDWTRIIAGAVILAVGLGGYYGWPWLKAQAARLWSRRTASIAQPSSVLDDEAYRAVKLLQAHAKATANPELAAAAKAAGVALFREAV